MLLLVFAMPLSAQAASKVKYKKTGVTTPSAIKKGSSFSLRGTITCNKKIKEVRVTIYNSTRKKCLQRYTAKPNRKKFSIAQADPYIIFNRLSVGTYYYQVRCKTASGWKFVVKKKFTVVGDGNIKIVNPKPAKNITILAGGSYSVGGKITSTYKLSGVTASILNSKNKKVYSKTVKPNKTSYTIGTAIDNAMLFDRLSAGSYKYKVTATDSQGKTATLIYRTVTVQGGTQTTTPASTGGGSNQNTGNYLNYNGVVTTPSNFTERTTRPAANNVYYYNKNYNIYYKYNALAPTGKAYYGKVYVLGNCTWYACGRALEIVANAGGNIQNVKDIFGGDPVGIYQANKAKKKFKYGKTPKVGALAIFDYGADGDAHIAVVERVVNGVPYVSESGYTESTKKPNAAKSNIVFKYQSIYNWAMGRNLKGYIYLI